MSKLRAPLPAHLAPEILARVSARLAAEPAVRFAFVFGSAAKGQAFRDVDVAVSLAPGALRGVAFGALVADLEQAAGTPVDVVDLSAAALPLVGEVLRSGRLLVERDPDERRRWEVEATRIWLDIEPWLRRQDDLWLRKLQGEGPWSTKS